MMFDGPPLSASGASGQAGQTVAPVGLQDNRIGGRLERVRAQLLALTSDLGPRLDGLAQPLLAQSRNVLERRTCRIAVIGQIKAGKSTFINAIAGRPGLLPTDINPWTAVVTLLQFRDGPTVPAPAARFQLFSATEWASLAEGGGRLRELTQQLIPDFRPELLKAQFELMRGRAERRLGASFTTLLGQTHSFEHITRDLLTDYISAGDEAPGDGMASHRPCYSDITRTAELRFEQGPFAFPVTLIDTPGTNDPFLVRDEITRRSLENPDIFIFVISALQPLTSADITMLQLINGLHKDRIVVFINRVDQLADPVRHGAMIKHRVESRLAHEFPALNIPVVIGSAAWANLALRGHGLDVAAVRRILTPQVLAANGLDVESLMIADDAEPAQQASIAHALHVAAGMPAMSAILDTLMTGSASSSLLAHIGSCLMELTRGKEVALRMELGALSGQLQSRQAQTAALHDKIAQERHVLADFDSRAAQLHSVLDDIEIHLGDIVTANMAPLAGNLQALVSGFADAKARAMEQSLRQQTARPKWVCDVRPLREQMEVCYLEICRSLGAELGAIEAEIQPILRHAVESLMPGSGRDYDGPPRAAALHRPSVQPLRQTLVLDLSVSWWNQWFAARPDPELRAEQLRTLIEAEFGPVTAELVREAQAYFGWHIAHTLDKARAVAESILSSVKRRNGEIMAEFETWQRQGEPAGDQDFEARQCRRAVDLAGQRARLAADIQEIGRQLAALGPTVTPCP